MRRAAPIDVLALSPIACAAVPWRMAGALRVTVVVKATFAITPDHDAKLVEPAPLEREDRYQDRDAARSLRRGSDLAPYLAGAGVVLVGHAYAPSGTPVTGVSARLAIYGAEPLLDKTVHVYGDVAPGGDTPAPFLQMPLVYERAYGGASVPSNPVGVGLEGARPPNLLHPTNLHRPAGFGPIAPGWPSRRRLFAGLEARARGDEILELPAELDLRAFNAAPSDQQIAPLSGGEWIVLDNLRAGAARVETRLPSAQARARWHLDGAAGAEQELELVADTLIVDTDRQTLSLVWRESFALEDAALLSRVRASAGLALRGEPIAWPDRAAPPDVDLPDDEDPLAHTGPAQPLKIAVPVLPFQAPSAPRLDPPPAPPPAREATAMLPVAALVRGQDARAPFALAAPGAPRADGEGPIPGAPWSAVPAVPLAAPEERTVLQTRAALVEAPGMGARARALEGLANGSGFDDADLSGADLSELDFTGRSMQRCKLRGAILRGARLAGAQLQHADLREARLDDADLGGAVLEDASLDGASLVGARLDGARLARAHGEGADFDAASLRGADLRSASFPRGSFVRAVLREAHADQADFTGARLLRADLGAASFRKARLRSAVLAHATLDGADLRNADLERANVHATARRSAKMAGANTKDLDEDPPAGGG